MIEEFVYLVVIVGIVFLLSAAKLMDLMTGAL